MLLCGGGQTNCTVSLEMGGTHAPVEAYTPISKYVSELYHTILFVSLHTCRLALLLCGRLESVVVVRLKLQLAGRWEGLTCGSIHTRF